VALLSPRKARVIIFNVALVALIVAVQTSWFSAFLDDILGLKWSSSIVGFLKQNTQGLIIILLLELYATWVLSSDKRESVTLSRSELSEIATTVLASRDARSLVEAGFKQFLGTSDGVHSLVDRLLPPHPFFRDTTVLITYQPIDGSTDQVRWQQHLTFTAAIDKLHVVVTNSRLTTQSVFANFPEATEVYTMTQGMSLDGAAALVQQRLKVDVSAPDTGRIEPNRRLTFQELSPSQRRGFVQTRSTLDPETVRIFRANTEIVPSVDGMRQFSFLVEDTRNLSQRYSLWMVERPVYVRSITFDFSRLLDADKFDFQFIPFFMVVRNSHTPDLDENRYRFDIDAWLTSGQGIIAVWGPSGTP
jgi:hypothetical protein